jgi:hypothetical protein
MAKEDDEVCSERGREEDAERSDNAHLHSGYATGETASVFEISLPASVLPPPHPSVTSLSFFSFFCFLFVFPLFWVFRVFKKKLGPIVPSFFFFFPPNFLMLHQNWRSIGHKRIQPNLATRQIFKIENLGILLHIGKLLELITLNMWISEEES